MAAKIINELSNLLAQGIITPTIAEKITLYYNQKESENQNKLSIIFGILGALLVGLGIILVFAHNWDTLSRITKTVLCFLPLVVAQGATFYSFIKKPKQTAWKESTAALLFFGVGSSIALLSQTYHIPGDLNSFLITWMLLCLPLVLLLKTSIVSLLYILGITYYSCNSNYFSYPRSHSYLYWLLLLGIIPHYYYLLKNTPKSNFTVFHNWFITLSIIICAGTIAYRNESLIYLLYMNLFTVFYLIGKTSFFENQKLKNNSYLIFGKVGIVYLLLLYSFKWFWSKSIFNTLPLKDNIFSAEFIVLMILTLIVIILFYINNKKTKFREITILELAFLINVLLFISEYEFSILANGIVLAIGVAEIKRGNTQNHLGILNFGLLLVTLLIICRFFDTDLSFVLRGILFISIGLGFFITNYLILKKRNSDQK